MDILISAIYFVSIILKIVVLARIDLVDLGTSRSMVALICLPAIVAVIDKRLGGITEQYHWLDLLVQLLIIFKVFLKLYHCKDHYRERLTRFSRLVLQCCPSFH